MVNANYAIGDTSSPKVEYFTFQVYIVTDTDSGLFTVPTRIVIVIAPINVLLNYLLVWGPEPIRLGFIGAPIATCIRCVNIHTLSLRPSLISPSMNLMSLLSILYGIYWVPRTAWHPFCRRSFQSLGVIVQLGLAGVGQTASEWWSWELIGRQYFTAFCQYSGANMCLNQLPPVCKFASGAPHIDNMDTNPALTA